MNQPPPLPALQGCMSWRRHGVDRVRGFADRNRYYCPQWEIFAAGKSPGKRPWMGKARGLHELCKPKKAS